MHDENTVMVELDMLFPIKKYEEMRKEMDSMEKGDEQSGGRKKRKAIIPTAAYRWTNERIPYEVSGAFSELDWAPVISVVEMSKIEYG